jgi:F-type H+-transporting ATPase subunit b
MKMQISNLKTEIRKAAVFGIIGFCQLAPAIAAAAEEAEHQMSVMDWVWKLLNFGILVGVLGYFLAKPIKEHLKQRRELIEKSIKESQEAKSLAAKALAEV